ncbi:MAG: hypothetical protein LBP75_00525, partial [Planctomycetota bacterium]|jgi:hypothetical protein|nr:hypothetical protein [Planctomycetota bacterium]
VINSGKVPAKAITSAADPFYYRNRFNPAVFTKQGGGAALSYFQSNPAQTQDWELQKIQKPDWSQILLPPKQPVMSEDEYVAAIKEQARKDFAAGACANTESFSNLWQTYVSEVSPDRQAIYAESMQKTGGYMNLGAAFFADDGQMVMMYSRDEQMGKNQNMNVMTEEEWARSRKFYDLYRGEMAAQSQNSASSQSGARLDINVAIKESINVTA